MYGIFIIEKLVFQILNTNLFASTIRLLFIDAIKAVMNNKECIQPKDDKIPRSSKIYESVAATAIAIDLVCVIDILACIALIFLE